MTKFSLKPIAGDRGVTLVELIVYVAIVGIVMGAVYTTFKRQQDSYLVQERLAILQQNLRGAMTLLASDLQMAGYFTCYDPRAYTFPYDWDGDTLNESIRPLLFGQGNSIVIIKASNDTIDNQALAAGESANAGSGTITVDNTDGLNFNTTSRSFGVLVKSDLSRAELFQVTNATAGSLTVTPAAATLVETYFSGPTAEQSDRIARVDVIEYSVDGNNNLIRTNRGDGTSQTVAEHISGLQFSYAVANDIPPATDPENWQATSIGTKDAPPDGDAQTYDEREIRRIQVTLTGTIQVSPRLGNKQRSLSSTIKVRNMGMDML